MFDNQFIENLIGQKIGGGRYLIERKLNKSGQGQVFEGRDVQTGERRAIKCLLSAKRDKNIEDKIEKFDHEYVIKSFKFLRENIKGTKCYFWIMEFFEGVNFPVKILDHMDIRNALELFLKACEGFEYIHEFIKHRDIKPQNILVNMDNLTLKILDFSLSGPVDKPSKYTHERERIGAIRYMSPEQARGEINKVDERSDIFSLGVLFFESLSGINPFDLDGTNNDQKINAKISFPENNNRYLSQTYKDTGLLPHIPERLADIIDKCLMKSKSKRYQTVSCLMGKLKKLKNNLPLYKSIKTYNRSLSKTHFLLKKRAPMSEAINPIIEYVHPAFAEIGKDKLRNVGAIFYGQLTQPYKYSPFEYSHKILRRSLEYLYQNRSQKEKGFMASWLGKPSIESAYKGFNLAQEAICPHLRNKKRVVLYGDELFANTKKTVIKFIEWHLSLGIDVGFTRLVQFPEDQIKDFAIYYCGNDTWGVEYVLPKNYWKKSYPNEALEVKLVQPSNLETIKVLQELFTMYWNSQTKHDELLSKF